MGLNRVRVVWSQFSGQPGYTNFYFDSASAPPLAALTTLFTAFKAYVPVGLTWTVPNSGDTIDETTGHITGGWTGAVQTPVVGAGGGANFVGSSGAVILWKTADPVNGRRPIGKSYIVPMSTGQFDTDGSLLLATVTGVLNAALTFVTAAGAAFKVWHRPKYDNTVDPPVLLTPGSAVTCIGATVPDLAAVMRSRRR